MTRANRDFAETSQPWPKIPGFNPGGDDFGVVRMIDGHNPTETGEEGSNVHVPSAARVGDWDDAFSQYDPE